MMIKDIFILAAWIFLLLLGLALLIDTHIRYQCNNYQKMTGTVSKYITLDTCYVKRDGVWFRLDEYTRIYRTHSHTDEGYNEEEELRKKRIKEENE